MGKSIEEAIKGVDGYNQWLGRREIKELPNLLWDNEHAEKIVTGTYNNGNGILVATNKRLIFIDKGMLWGLKVEDFPYDKISTIQYEKGMLLGKITVFTSGNKGVISNVAKQYIQDFCEYVRARVTKPTEHAAVRSSSQSNNDDMIIQIEKLAKLKEQGILTEEEFQAKKKQILGL